MPDLSGMLDARPLECSGAEGVTQLVKYLLCMHGDMSLTPHLIKNLDVVAQW